MKNIEIIGADEETREAVAKVIAPTMRPLAERITQGPYRLSQSTLYFSNTEGAWIAAVREGFLPSGEKDANTELIAEAFNVTHETGKTPAQLRDERAELIASLAALLNAYAPHRDESKLDALQSDVRRAVELLSRLDP